MNGAQINYFEFKQKILIKFKQKFSQSQLQNLEHLATDTNITPNPLWSNNNSK